MRCCKVLIFQFIADYPNVRPCPSAAFGGQHLCNAPMCRHHECIAKLRILLQLHLPKCGKLFAIRPSSPG